MYTSFPGDGSAGRKCRQMISGRYMSFHDTWTVASISYRTPRDANGSIAWFISFVYGPNAIR